MRKAKSTNGHRAKRTSKAKSSIKSSAHKIKNRVSRSKAGQMGNPEESLALSGLNMSDEEVRQKRKETIKQGKKRIIPMQQRLGRIVAWTVSISLVFVVIFSVYVWRSMYVNQSVSDLNYAISRIVPLKVGEVDGHKVSYESYLFKLRINLHFLREQEKADFVNDEAGQAIYADQKLQAMKEAMKDKLAESHADELGIKVTSQEVDDYMQTIFDESGEDAVESAAKSVFGTDISGVKRLLRSQMLQARVAAATDDDSLAEAQDIYSTIKDESSAKKAAQSSSDDFLTREEGGLVKSLKPDSPEYGQSFKNTAFAMQNGETSEPFLAWVQSDKYRAVYYVIYRLKGSEEDVSVRFVQINTKDAAEAFDPKVDSLIKEGKATDSLGLIEKS